MQFSSRERSIERPGGQSSARLRDHPVAIAAARHGLSGVVDPPRPVELAPADVDPVRVFCRTDRISGLLACAVRAGGVVMVEGPETDDARAGIEQDWHDALHACVLLEALLIRTARRLNDANVRWLVTKGPAVAHLDYPAPSLRTFADVDLVIHPDDWERAELLLAPAAVSTPWRRRYVRKYGKGTTASIDDMEVDLHLRYAVGRFGLRCRTAECFDDTAHLLLADQLLPAPSRGHRLLHACYHAVLGGSAELRAFRDIAQMSLEFPDDFDDAWRIARRWNVEAVMASAIIETWERLRLPSSHEVAARAMRVEIGRSDDRALGVFARREGFRPQALTAITELPWTGRLGFLHTSWMMSREQGG